MFNDGKGLQMSVSLIGLLLHPKPGEKQRANAKPPVVTKVVYIHKKTSFIDGLYIIIRKTLNRCDLCQGGITCNGDLDECLSALFSLEYTIPHVQNLKDIQLVSEDDWATFLEEASKKSSSTAKLVVREKLV